MLIGRRRVGVAAGHGAVVLQHAGRGRRRASCCPHRTRSTFRRRWRRRRWCRSSRASSRRGSTPYSTSVCGTAALSALIVARMPDVVVTQVAAAVVPDGWSQSVSASLRGAGGRRGRHRRVVDVGDEPGVRICTRRGEGEDESLVRRGRRRIHVAHRAERCRGGGLGGEYSRPELLCSTYCGRSE